MTAHYNNVAEIFGPGLAVVLDSGGSDLKMLGGPKMVMTDGDDLESWTPIFAVDFTGNGKGKSWPRSTIMNASEFSGTP